VRSGEASRLSLPLGYKHVRSLGDGFFANVLEVDSESLGDRAAMKRLKAKHTHNQDYVKRFKREIGITKQLKEVDGVVPVLDSGEHEGRPFLVMPIADCNLEHYVRKRLSPLDTEVERLALVRSVAQTIADAHDAGVLHRDVHPGNVLMFGDDPMVSDFGLGKTRTQLTALTRSNAKGYGRLLYVAPEQREQLGNATELSDIYSLGRVIDFVMTGQDPDHVVQHSLSAVTARCTKVEPADRMPTAVEVVDAVSRSLNLYEQVSGGDIVDHEDLAGALPPFDWPKIHELLVRSGYQGHVYSEYLDPVTKFFD
jgi:serine/threonine protein kinase